MSENEFFYQPDVVKEVGKVFQKIGCTDFDSLRIALRGGFKEYLFATDSELIIAKKGYMTGHTFGYGVFRMPYSNITSVTVNFHILTGYFEVAAGGVQSSPKSFWGQKDNSAGKAPNVISLASKQDRDTFAQAANIINKYLAVAHQPQQAGSTDVADEIRKLKGLADDGIISNEEFEAKKKQLLGL
ncbi:SHOCT domain-containing protein [Lactiplantibacillus songbeiensis]|uniref:SHOCT domain-containing protein n=1 Tax=Lactiplantibacillus songbeiensis TaxID=2559920 RepID=A0ABW4C4T0_9LACO|nr:SHOCT domain-containing protein [Lactiplantibacillus songbeiensis]